jgi:hypothetical protein
VLALAGGAGCPAFSGRVTGADGTIEKAVGSLPGSTFTTGEVAHALRAYFGNFLERAQENHRASVEGRCALVAVALVGTPYKPLRWCAHARVVGGQTRR